MTWAYIIAGVVLFLAALLLFMIFPSGRRAKSKEYFKDKTFCAHRGLFNNNAGIPENSLSAFSEAIRAGYGIELDVHITSDKKLVVFHDDYTHRMCGEKLKIEKSTLAQLSGLNLLGTDEKIPTLEEFLALVGGKVPLIIEIKGENTSMQVCEYTAKVLDDYDGEYCIESFNPFYIGWWRKHRPDVIRGQLACKTSGKRKFVRHLRDFALGNLLLNFISRPDFVAYDVGGIDRLAFRTARALGAYPVAWTLNSAEQLEKAQKYFSVFICEQPLLSLKRK